MFQILSRAENFEKGKTSLSPGNRDCVCLSLHCKNNGHNHKILPFKMEKRINEQNSGVFVLSISERFNLNAFIDQTKISKYSIYTSSEGVGGGWGPKGVR